MTNVWDTICVVSTKDRNFIMLGRRANLNLGVYMSSFFFSLYIYIYIYFFFSVSNFLVEKIRISAGDMRILLSESGRKIAD